MTEYKLVIRATLEARNLSSATSKAEQIKEAVSKLAPDQPEVHLVGTDDSEK